MTIRDEVSSFLSEFPAHSYEEWRALVDQILAGAPFEKKLVTKLPEGIDLKPLYTRQDAKGCGVPGEYPYLRGTAPSGQLGKQWRMFQEIPYADPSEVNNLLLADLKKGLNGFRLVLDKAARSGRWIREDVGVGGTSIASSTDLAKLFHDVDLSLIPLIVDGGLTTLPASRLFLETPQNSEIIFVNDIFALSQELGSLPTSFEKYFDEVSKELKSSPHALLGIDTRVYAEAGGSAVHELAFGIASVIQHLREFTERGVALPDITRHLTLNLSVGSRILPEIAKLRAARMLYAQVLKVCGGDAEAQKVKIFAASQRWNKTKHDVYVNMLRTTAEVFAAIIGGADGMSSSPFDVALGVPDDFSRRIARNTQLVLTEEGHLQCVIDPGGGSWTLESLTQEIAEKAWSLLQKVEELGGIADAMKDGFVRDEIARVSDLRKKDVSSRREVIVGTNMYADVRERPYTPVPHDTESLRERLQEENKLEQEVSFLFNGETDVPQLPIHRASGPYEDLRERASQYLSRHGVMPKVFLMTMGPLSQHKARADFAREFFEPGGYEVVVERGFSSTEEAVREAISSDARIVVICSSDDTYPVLVPEITSLLQKNSHPPVVVVAGYPQEHVQSFKEQGVDEFIHLRSDNLEMLQLFHSRIGA